MILQQWSKHFSRVICYYANIKMIKFWHNSKTSVQTIVPLGISKTQSSDCALKTLWHESNSAYINHQGDLEKTAQALQNGSFQAPPSFLYSFLHSFSPQHQKKKIKIKQKSQWNCGVLTYFWGRQKLWSIGVWQLSHDFYTDSGEKNTRLKKSSYCSVLKGILLISICQQQNLLISAITNTVRLCLFCFHGQLAGLHCSF